MIVITGIELFKDPSLNTGMHATSYGGSPAGGSLDIWMALGLTTLTQEVTNNKGYKFDIKACYNAQSIKIYPMETKQSVAV